MSDVKKTCMLFQENPNSDLKCHSLLLALFKATRKLTVSHNSEKYNLKQEVQKDVCRMVG